MRAHLGGSSRQSLVIARGKLDAAVKGATVESASALSSELFFIGDTFESNIAIRRAITDPSRDGASKAALLKDLFGKSVGVTALTLVTEVSALRWSATHLTYLHFFQREPPHPDRRVLSDHHSY